MRKFASFLDAVARAESMSVYEGLPRATDDELAKIKQANKTIELGGWSFYAAPLNTSQSTVDCDLRSLTIANSNSILPMSLVQEGGRKGAVDSIPISASNGQSKTSLISPWCVSVAMNWNSYHRLSLTPWLNLPFRLRIKSLHVDRGKMWPHAVSKQDADFKFAFGTHLIVMICHARSTTSMQSMRVFVIY